jgi:hypothetical protein
MGSGSDLLPLIPIEVEQKNSVRQKGKADALIPSSHLSTNPDKFKPSRQRDQVAAAFHSWEESRGQSPSAVQSETKAVFWGRARLVGERCPRG